MPNDKSTYWETWQEALVLLLGWHYPLWHGNTCSTKDSPSPYREYGHSQYLGLQCLETAEDCRKKSKGTRKYHRWGALGTLLQLISSVSDYGLWSLTWKVHWWMLTYPVWVTIVQHHHSRTLPWPNIARPCWPLMLQTWWSATWTCHGSHKNFECQYVDRPDGVVGWDMSVGNGNGVESVQKMGKCKERWSEEMDYSQ